MRGLRAPNAWAANGATAETSPIPKVKLTKNTVCASDAAATASLAETPDEGEIGRHHRDLPELCQRKGRGEAERLGKLEREMVAGRARA